MIIKSNFVSPSIKLWEPKPDIVSPSAKLQEPKSGLGAIQ